MPSQFEKYRFTKKTVLSDETFNKIFKDIDQRITSLEDIREGLIKHADRLTEIYNQVPEVPEEVFRGLVEDVLEDWTTRTVSFEEAREALYKRGYRLPYRLTF